MKFHTKNIEMNAMGKHQERPQLTCVETTVGHVAGNHAEAFQMGEPHNLLPRCEKTK